jgi:hypothetical protein
LAVLGKCEADLLLVMGPGNYEFSHPEFQRVLVSPPVVIALPEFREIDHKKHQLDQGNEQGSFGSFNGRLPL